MSEHQKAVVLMVIAAAVSIVAAGFAFPGTSSTAKEPAKVTLAQRTIPAAAIADQEAPLLRPRAAPEEAAPNAEPADEPTEEPTPLIDEAQRLESPEPPPWQPSQIEPQYSFWVYGADRLTMPGEVDSNSPAFWLDGQLVMFNSAKGYTLRTVGDAIDNLYDSSYVQLPVPERPGNVWIEAVWRDEEAGILYGWYHLEPSDVDCLTAPLIGAAISYDNGYTWEDRGTVIENPYANDCDYANGYMAGGNGDFDVILDQEHGYFYFLFSNYAGPLDEQGVAIARSSFRSRGQPGAVRKLYNGDWTEPGVGGKATAIFKSSTGWKGPYIEAFWGPSVHWNEYLHTYVMLLNHTAGENYTQEGIYISFSDDLVSWTEPYRIIEGGSWYAEELVSAEYGDIPPGQLLRLYISGVSDYVIDFG